MNAAAVSHDAQSLHSQSSTNERICQDGITQWVWDGKVGRG